jgi:molybdopterin synthase catalytic subunit
MASTHPLPTPVNASVETSLETPEGICVLTYEPLDVERIRSCVSDDGAGASVVFIGTTRNNFAGERSI